MMLSVGWQIGDERADVGDQIGIRQRRSFAWPGCWAMAHCGRVWASDANRLCDRAHRPSRGNEVERNSSFFGPAARDTASRSSSFSMAFFPSSRV
jgi:hypothetical protein